jgi:hypothetical protein
MHEAFLIFVLIMIGLSLTFMTVLIWSAMLLMHVLSAVINYVSSKNESV